jgi:hypothetical protein
MDEILRSGRRVAEETGRRVDGFAPPFGRITPTLRDAVRQSYRWSVSARLERAGAASDVFDLPRIEMWYFRDMRRWRSYVERGWTPYFAFRRVMRAAREIV